MMDSGQKAEKQLSEITECPICMNAFVDPRVLPCIHTFCFECLRGNADAAQKKPGDKMPCPLCRKDFIIPEEGVNGVQKNFFMKNLLEVKTTLRMGSATITCDMCDAINEDRASQIPTATMRCLQCQENYCLNCVKVHKFQKFNKDHQMVTIGCDAKSEMKRQFAMRFCSNHVQKPLDYYCADCKKIVCVSCFVESHKLHDCKDVTKVDDEFRKTIERKATKISTCMNESLFMINDKKERKAEFLRQINEKEAEIYKRNQELIDIIERHTKSLLEELSVIKSNHLKEMETQMEDIERCRMIMGSFEAYCTELALEGSASDICSSVDQIIVRADELERDHEALIGRPHTSVEVSFQAINLNNASTSLVGYVKETTTELENVAVVVGLSDGIDITTDVIQINLHRANEISTQEQIAIEDIGVITRFMPIFMPVTNLVFAPRASIEMETEVVAAVYRNTMYVTGIGTTNDEIYKYNSPTGWTKCASLVEGRRRHSAAFIDEVLYICGGFVDSTELVLDSVEAFNAVTNKCTAVGKLIYAVDSSGNCVPFRSSLYIFGGSDKDDKVVSHVQVYNTRDNICTLISKPMPRPCYLMRAVILETSVILLGHGTSFIFNIETETWQEREQFKTGVTHFGLVLENGRLFVFGGGTRGTDKDGNAVGTYTCSDDVRYVPLQNIIDDKPIEWKIHGKLPKPSLVHAYANMCCSERQSAIRIM